MKIRIFLSMAVILFVLILRVAAQDPVKVAPAAFIEKLNNEHVRVIEYHSKPGEKEDMHSHAAGVIYVVKAVNLNLSIPTAQQKKWNLKPVMFYGAKRLHTLLKT